MATRYYTPIAQATRELYWLWRCLRGSNVLLGTLVTLAAFYVFHSPGHSQVYDVGLPFLTSAAFLVMLVFEQSRPERTGRTAAFYTNLPRDPEPAFAAAVLYFLGHAVYYELLIALGVYFKLGGADITPIYRIHPEIASLPFAAVLGSLWYCRETRSRRYDLVSIVVVALFVGLLVARDASKPAANFSNNFLPPRDYSLGQEWAMAALMFAISAAACWGVRGKRLSTVGDKS